MLIRIMLRAIPLFCVAIFTLGVYLTDTPMERAREWARLDQHRLAWASALVRCPDPWGNLPVSACVYANPPRISAPPH